MVTTDFSGRDIVKVLRKHNYRIVGRRGSHVQLRHVDDDTGEVRNVTVPQYDRIDVSLLHRIAQEKRHLEDDYEGVVKERDALAERVNHLEAELEDREAASELRSLRDELDELIDRHTDVLTVEEGHERLREQSAGRVRRGGTPRRRTPRASRAERPRDRRRELPHLDAETPGLEAR